MVNPQYLEIQRAHRLYAFIMSTENYYYFCFNQQCLGISSEKVARIENMHTIKFIKKTKVQFAASILRV